jgi:hypothetical protein
MEFPSLVFARALERALNVSQRFAEASAWSDVKVLLRFGDQQYWMKLYRGKVIDLMEYYPMSNPLGWDYVIGASTDSWNTLLKGSRPIGHMLDTGTISVDGNLLQANRMYESTHVILTTMRDMKIYEE